MCQLVIQVQEWGREVWYEPDDCCTVVKVGVRGKVHACYEDRHASEMGYTNFSTCLVRFSEEAHCATIAAGIELLAAAEGHPSAHSLFLMFKIHTVGVVPLTGESGDEEIHGMQQLVEFGIVYVRMYLD
jgi:hypothetical protein